MKNASMRDGTRCGPCRRPTLKYHPLKQLKLSDAGGTGLLRSRWWGHHRATAALAALCEKRNRLRHHAPMPSGSRNHQGWTDGRPCHSGAPCFDRHRGRPGGRESMDAVTRGLEPEGKHGMLIGSLKRRASRLVNSTGKHDAVRRAGELAGHRGPRLPARLQDEPAQVQDGPQGQGGRPDQARRSGRISFRPSQNLPSGSPWCCSTEGFSAPSRTIFSALGWMTGYTTPMTTRPTAREVCATGSF